MSDQATIDTPTQTTPPAAGFLGGNTPAPPATTTPSRIFGGHVNDEGTFSEGWTKHIEEAGFQTLAGKLITAKDEKGALSILDNAIKTASRRELKGAPTEAWAESEVAEYRKAFGVPEKPEEYGFKPEKLPEGLSWDDGLGKEFETEMHKLNAPKAVVDKVLEMYSKTLESTTNASKASHDAKLIEGARAAEAAFKQEWGVEYDQRFQANDDYVRSQFTPEELGDPFLQHALNNPKVVKIIDAARRGSREIGLPGPANALAGGSASPGQLAAAIMKTDDYKKGVPEAIHRVNDLYNQQAAIDKRNGVTKR